MITSKETHMHIRVASDLHLEGFQNVPPEKLAEGFLPVDVRDSTAVLVLAGDISSKPDQLIEFIEHVESRFKHVIYVPGNHEVYKHNFDVWNDVLRTRFKELKNTSAAVADEVLEAVIDGVRFIFGTLWADGGPTQKDREQVNFYLNDFRLILRNLTDEEDALRPRQRFFTVDDMVSEFKKQRDLIDEKLKVPFEGKTVVVTHHLPSRRLVSARFWPHDGSDGANGGFVGACENILAYDHAPALWIHGHTHDSIDTELWKTRIICNPAGYRGEWMSSVNTFMKPNDKGSRETVPVFVEI